MHIVKAIEREAATLPDEYREGFEMRVRTIIDNAASRLVVIRDDAKAMNEVKRMAAKGGDDGELRE
jgi:hypothetical protein